MSEDMTYAPVQTVAQLQERVRELESELSSVRHSEKLFREAWEAIPTGAMFDYWDGSEAVTPDAKEACDTFGDWVEEVRTMVLAAMRYTTEVQP